MGSSYGIYCWECGYTLKLRWGVGMIYPRAENLPGMLPKRLRVKVQAMLERPDCSQVSYSHQLYSCPHCDLPASRLNYRIEFEGGEIYQPSFRCSRCRRKLVEIEDFKLIEECPDCGSRFLLTSSGDWD